MLTDEQKELCRRLREDLDVRDLDAIAAADLIELLAAHSAGVQGKQERFSELKARMLKHIANNDWHKDAISPETIVGLIELLEKAISTHHQPTTHTDAARDVLAERARQVNVEGWTAEHDDAHCSGQLAIAAGWYALNSPFIGKQDCLGDPMDGSHEAHRIFAGKFTAMRWPWTAEWWKPTTQRRDLVKAAALILAEIERLDRAKGE